LSLCQVHLDLGFEEAIVGAVKEVGYELDAVCAACDGSGGRDGSKAVACPRCGGEGEVYWSYRTMFARVRCSAVYELSDHVCEGEVQCRV
jgi:molecular chaperone DnaJ